MARWWVGDKGFELKDYEGYEREAETTLRRPVSLACSDVSGYVASQCFVSVAVRRLRRLCS